MPQILLSDYANESLNIRVERPPDGSAFEEDLGMGWVAAIRKQASFRGQITARYPIAIEPGTEQTSFGIVVPDLPGCFSAGDTLHEAMIGVDEAVAAWIDAALAAGDAVPGPSSLDVIQTKAAYAGWTFAVVSVDPGLLDDMIERHRAVPPVLRT